MGEYADDFFVANRWMLRMAGLWRPDSKNSIVQYAFLSYAISSFFFVNIFFTATEFVSLLETVSNEYDMLKNISFAMTHFLGACKVVFFFYFEERLKNIISKLELVYKYEDCESRDYYPGAISKQYKKEGITYSVAYIMLPHATLLASYIPPTIAAILYDENDPDSVLPNRMPYYCWMPFKFDTKETYLIGLGYQSIAMFSYAYSICGMDTLYTNTMRAIRMNLEIIHGAILTIRERVIAKHEGHLTSAEDGLYDSEELMKSLKTEMNKIINHLQVIYDVCQELEEVYLFLNLAQAMATLLILCSCLYLVTSTPVSGKQFAAEIVYLFAMGCQIYLFCKGGDEVTQKAAELPDSLWRCEWLSTDSDFKKSMILTMARSQKPLLLTAGKFVPLTLTTFVTIVRASYSMCAFLKSSG